MSAPQFTRGPWIADEFCEENDQATRVGTYDSTPAYYHRTATIALCQTNHEDDEPDGVPKIGIVEAEANARLIAAAPELYEAAAKHLEWIEKEQAGPDYGGLARDTHPDGERIWRAWWNEQLDLCADTERLCRAALARARGETA